MIFLSKFVLACNLFHHETAMEDHVGNEELEKIWEQVLREYEKLTERTLGQATPEQLERRLDEVNHTNEEDILKKSLLSAFKVAKHASSATSAVSKPR